jgi:hypothetical protein
MPYKENFMYHTTRWQTSEARWERSLPVKAIAGLGGGATAPSESAGSGTGAGELALALVPALVDAGQGLSDNRLQFRDPLYFLCVFRIHRGCCSDVDWDSSDD